MKLRPTFSFQKYQDAKLDPAEQFEYLLQQEHIETANALNSTVDDMSYFFKNSNPAERETGYRWVDGRAIWKKTFTGTITGTSTNATAHGISGIQDVVRMYGAFQDASPLGGSSGPLPYIDPGTLANGLGISIDLTNYYVNAANNTWDTYEYKLTIEYTKV